MFQFLLHFQPLPSAAENRASRARRSVESPREGYLWQLSIGPVERGASRTHKGAMRAGLSERRVQSHLDKSTKGIFLSAQHGTVSNPDLNSKHALSDITCRALIKRLIRMSPRIPCYSTSLSRGADGAHPFLNEKGCSMYVVIATTAIAVPRILCASNTLCRFLPPHSF